MKRTRLLLVTPFYYPRHYGGAVQVYHNLIQHLQRHAVTVLTDRSDGGEDEERAFDAEAPERYGYAVRRIDRLCFQTQKGPLLRRVGELLQFARRVRRQSLDVLGDVRPDIVVCGASYNTGWLINWLFDHVPNVNYVHGEELTIDNLTSGMVARWTWNQQLKRMRNADLNLGVSEFTCRNLVEVGGADPERVVFFPNFVDTSRFRPVEDRAAVRAKLGWSGKLVFLCVARLVPRKGIDHAMEALAALDADRHDWIFCIGGLGPEEKSLRAQAASLGVQERVRFLGFVDDEELPELYGAADVFLQPNREVAGSTEGFGIVFLEANACGIPVVGGRAGGTAGAIIDGTTGYRVDGDDVSAVNERLRLLADDPELRQRLGRQGLERVQQEFTVEVAAQQFERLMDRVNPAVAVNAKS